jgi:uncharacterized protein
VDPEIGNATTPPGRPRVRPAGPGDFAAVHALNQDAVPAMNPVDPGFFGRLAPLAAAFLVAGPPGDIAGFLLALPAGIPYDSPNYRWFEERYDDFVYIDRVAVSAARRGRGVGRALYAALHDTLKATLDTTPHAATAPAPLLCCEVNLHPPNPGSLAFHLRLGFRVVGEQETEGGRKRVALLVRAE